MNPYITGEMIKKCREEAFLTQEKLAEKIGVSPKAVSRWETGRGYPDITLLEPLSAALGISLPELFSGSAVRNGNTAFNMRRSKIYVCPLCGNMIFGIGEAVVCCHGITLLPAEAEEADENHAAHIETVEDEYYIQISHPMEKEHYISFVLALGDFGAEMIKLYPEGDSSVRLKKRGVRFVYYYCNRHGLFRLKL